jgi:hypothetical protein
MATGTIGPAAARLGEHTDEVLAEFRSVFRDRAAAFARR